MFIPGQHRTSEQKLWRGLGCCPYKQDERKALKTSTKPAKKIQQSVNIPHLKWQLNITSCTVWFFLVFKKLILFYCSTPGTYN